ncbi:MAG: ribosome silencing factor [Lachnospiraceae bacterium]|nr:ribosome silencing factor [Lachnospiraceae bacterium]MBQ9563765.1 ribosome silencing factor [Lachnospiraceae bacterium]MBR0152611.1 ribosome silencing factor [Lachnospiraceae bacterium]
METRDQVKLIYNALADKKAEDIRIIEIGDISVIADYFVIANGTNPNQVSALVDSVEQELAKIDVMPKRIEGIGNASWVLMDYGDIIIHIFSKEDRAFYDLERIWRDGKTVSGEDL